ncbi:sugar ABC transporter substrate-binding protein [Kribbella sp.]|uniref:ABC transporter substrate-binding protein n=1 Tax=Kribbella sp. TaxID=1871183 RepID=UPI002D418FEE|nr:sugar ABC transporter substrate-binding protein [Kribbella sp.]HZX08221.1 sugar ABC transporter substrate-binding protein [Kribbella sp.]
MKITRTGLIVATVAMLAAAMGCSSGSGGQSGAVTVNWWTWDPNQAVAYQQCIPDFEKANPGITVHVSQYGVSDYFTKLTAGFVAGDAPDAFMNAVDYLQPYVSQHQLMPLDKFIGDDHFNLGQYSIGASAWEYTDGKRYALPMDWATTVLYYNKGLLAKAGYTPADVDRLSWNPQDGGSLWHMIKHVTVDKNGTRGDEPGFDPGKLARYGIGNLETTGNPIGQNAWGMLLAADNINIPNKSNWATEFGYAAPQVAQSVQLIRSLTNDGYSPQLNQFSTAAAQQLASGAVTMYLGGTWEVNTFLSLPGVKVGIAPMPAGSDGVRRLMANSNGNNMWAGTKYPEQTWKWMSYQESLACQTKASTYNSSFLPSIGAASAALIKSEAAKGHDLSVFADYVKNHELFPSPVYNNGSAITNYVVPQFEAYFTNKADNGIFATMQEKVKTLLAQK